MNRKIAAATAALGTTLALLVPPGTAVADSDYASRSGHCSQGAHYTMTVREREHPDRLATTFYVNGRNSKHNSTWTITIKRNGVQVYKWHKTSNSYNNVTFAKTIYGDDEDKVTITLKSSYGEVCTRSIRLDND